jgi:hypothetical protein
VLLISELQLQSTGFPQNLFTLCKSCSKKKDFVRNCSSLHNLNVVEKNFAKRLLYELNSANIILVKVVTDVIISTDRIIFLAVIERLGDLRCRPRSRMKLVP